MADIEQYYMKPPGSCFWVAVLDGNVVGIVAARAHAADNTVELLRMSVDSRFRGRGIAKALGRQPGGGPCCSPAARLPQRGPQCCPHFPGPPAGHTVFSGGCWPRCGPLGLSRAPRPAWAFCRCPLQRVGKGPVSPPGEALTIPETGATPAPGGSPVNSGSCESSTSNSSSS
uniref:N-acetylaspartate synthetase n=1 Tax=Capra hircus TaxID=9925 RepID=A0A8C2RIH8_CAPHI